MEKDYNAIFDAANDAIFVHDIETGEIIDANSKACEMYLYSREELITMHPADISPGSVAEGEFTREYANKMMDKAASGEPHIFQWLAKDKAGRIFWVEVNLKRAIIGGRYRLLAIVRDITDRKRTEDRLSNINEVFLNFGPNPSENINRLTGLCGRLLGADCALYNRIEGNMIHSCGQWNTPPGFPAVSEAKGHICYDVARRPKDDLVIISNLPETDYALTDPAVDKYKLKTYIGIPVKFADIHIGVLCVLYQHDYFPTDEEKKIIGIIASAIGVEENRKSAEDVSHLAEFSIQKASDEAFWIGPDASILYVNDSACRALGYSREELLTMKVHDIDVNFPENIWQQHWKELKEKCSITFESRQRRKDGSIFPVEITANFVEWSGDEYNFAFVRDVAERKRSEEALIKRDYQLEVLSRTSQHINAVLDVKVILRTLVAAAMELVEAGAGTSGLFSDGRMKFSEYNKGGSLIPISYTFTAGQGLPGYVISQRKPHISNDPATDPKILPEKLRELNFYNAVCIPILDNKGDLLGCFEIYNKKSAAKFDVQDVFMLQGLAASAAIAIDNARAIERLKAVEEELREERDRAKKYFDVSGVIMVVINSHQKVSLINKAGCDMLGYPAEEIVGKDWFDNFVPSHSGEEVKKEFVRLISGKSKAVEYYENPIVTKSGRERLIAWHNSVLTDKEGNIMFTLSSGLDITERKSAQQTQEHLTKELLRTNEELKRISLVDAETGLYNHRFYNDTIDREFQRASRSAQPLTVIMIDIDYFRSINDVYGHEFGDIVLKQFAEQLTKMLRRYDMVIRFGGEEFVIISAGLDREKALGLSHRILDALSLFNFGTAKQTVKIKITMAVASYPEDKITKAADFMNIASNILEKAKEAGGNRVYSSSEVKKFKSDVYDESAPADITNLKGRIHELAKHEKQALIESIFAFAKTIEIRDHYTGEHAESTVRYATRIAEELKLAPDEVESIKEAATLHDLGKVGISDKILLKKSKLTKREFEEIKKHPQIAADIIRPMKFMHDIIPLVLYHHERWDGKGYPAELKGEEIPLGARIIAIADVYQALTSNRPYREAYKKKEAIEILRKGAGTQFDPAIVKAFLRVLEKRPGKK
jgi:diguanylate cyclase (GGDEF)-like protein/PAS domain S-box-containing protein